ncbi:hypothetical protein QQ045_019228 [Rhodiola kirilowii]
MGLNQFETQAEGLFPVMVINIILHLIMLRNFITSMLRFVGVVKEGSNGGGESVERRVRISRFEDMCWIGHCSVCLCGFECGEVVSELSCKHLFHRGCLEKWFCNNGGKATCPLCRSVM